MRSAQKNSEWLVCCLIYLVSAGLLALYGVRVCPFIDGLSQSDYGQVIGAIFGPVMVALLVRLAVSRLGEKPWRMFWLNLGLWLGVGLVIGAWNTLMLGFPVESMYKVVFGCLSLGTFVAMIDALWQEGQQLRHLPLHRERFNPDTQRFMSMTVKSSIFVGVCMLQFFVITLLLVRKDMQYYYQQLAMSNEVLPEFAVIFMPVFKEVLFVLSVITVGSVLVCMLYARNINFVIQQILGGLHRIKTGDLSQDIPLLSRDEFSQIAAGANSMIGGLREKEKIRSVFGKYLSPSIAQDMLERDQQTLLAGQDIPAAVLFADIRDFTALSEALHPQQVVQVLNEYFTPFVGSIHRHNGVLDKFIGDAVMAVFGLDGNQDACEQAVATAQEVLAALPDINRRLLQLGLPEINFGIGIHYGQVIAGNIGGEERMEYTVIGDTVNTAARIEAACKTHGQPLIISTAVFHRLPKGLQQRFEATGEALFRGKTQAIAIMGLAG